MKKVVLFSLLLFQACSQQKVTHKDSHHHFSDAQKWSKIFEDEKRQDWQEPQRVIKRVGVMRNSIVANIGSGTGYFSTRLAKTAFKGRVWGIDIEPNLIRYLNERARREKIHNLFSLLALENDPLIPEKVDFIFIVNTYHHIQKREDYLRKLSSSLKPKGKIVVIDFKKGELPFGPNDEMKLSSDKVISEFNGAGLNLFESFNFLKYQYILIFQAQ